MSTPTQNFSDDDRNARERADDADENEVTETRQALVTPPTHDTSDEEPGDATRQTIRDDAKERPAGGSAYAVADKVEHDAPYLTEQTSLETDERWRRIQSEFVDDPRKSVAEAHKLVGEVVQQIVDAFAQERNDLEQQWSKGDSVSTEDLRVCLQRYRAFFSRLLPSMKGITTH